MATVSSIDAEVQTEALPVLVDASAQAPPVPPEQAMAMQGFPGADYAMTWYSFAMAWYDTDEGQYALLRSLFQRGTAIPGRPRFDSESGRPVLRLALHATGRYAEGEPYWQFPKDARGAAPNSRRESRCGGWHDFNFFSLDFRSRAALHVVSGRASADHAYKNARH